MSKHVSNCTITLIFQELIIHINKIAAKQLVSKKRCVIALGNLFSARLDTTLSVYTIPDKYVRKYLQTFGSELKMSPPIFFKQLSLPYLWTDFVQTFYMCKFYASITLEIYHISQRREKNLYLLLLLKLIYFLYLMTEMRTITDCL